MKAELSDDRPFIWLASYPKSGNTWLRALLTALYAEIDGNEDAIALDSLAGGMEPFTRELLDDFAGIESATFTPTELIPYISMLFRSFAEDCEPPCFVKTHAARVHGLRGEPLFASEYCAGAVYVMRNPLDVAVSYAHHDSKEIDDIIDWMGDEDATLDRVSWNTPQIMRSWSTNVLTWVEDAPFPVLILRYEDMLDNSAAQLGRVAKFAGIDASEDQLKRAADRARFDQLKAREEESGFPEKPNIARAFFRAGRSGDGLRTLSSAQIARIAHDHGGVMERFGYGVGE